MTPWQADTVFGALCWAIVRREGEATLRTLLDLCAIGEPPLVLSNGMPGGLLPAPLILRPRPPASTREQAEAELATAKRRKGLTRLPLDAFHRACRGEDVAAALRAEPLTVRDTAKNTINRAGGGTVEQGGLYSVAEIWGAGGATVVIYARVEEGYTELIGAALRDLAQTGYGRRVSAGYGHVSLEEWAPTGDLDFVIPNANGFVALSNFCPATSDPTQGFYRTLVKYGRLGDELSVREGLSPFKRPLIQIAAGSCFYTDRPLSFYGRLVRGIHPQLPDVAQHGFTLAVPVALPSVG